MAVEGSMLIDCNQDRPGYEQATARTSCFIGQSSIQRTLVTEPLDEE